jgi:two-component system, OmpR family, aerobic respiration control sensor histidine kinase ArcB
MEEKKTIEYLRKLTFKLTGNLFSEEASIKDYVDNIVNYFNNILHSMPNNVYWLDRNCILRGGNDELAHKLNLKSGLDLEGLTYEQMAKAAKLPTKEFEPYRTTELEVMKTGIPSIAKEEPPIKAQGKTFYYLSNKTPLRNKVGEIIGVVGISTDITKLKETQLDLDMALKKVEAANNAKTEFIMNMSHDLRTPLSGIIGISNIQAKEGSNEKDKKLGAWVHHAGEQLLELLNSVIEVIAAEQPLDRIKKKKIDLIKFAKELQALMQPTLQNKKLTFQLKLDPYLPTIISDKIKLKTIFLNLLSNAIKFTKHGVITLEINLLSLSHEYAKIETRVTDTGIGIAKDSLDKIFDRFYRAHPSYKTQYTGYGIGLFLVKKSVEGLGGKIKVFSEKGKGSCFTLEFSFPIAKKRSQKGIVKSIDPTSDIKDTKKVKETVLVVEDNALALYAIRNILVNLGYDVIAITDGKKALHTLKNQQFSWVLLDIGLVDLDGTEVARRYRQWEQKNKKTYLPIFALTAHVKKEAIEKYKKIGIDHVFHKPFTEKNIKTIKRLLKK